MTHVPNVDFDINAETCTVPVTARETCGSAEVGQIECEEEGCCYDVMLDTCFHPSKCWWWSDVTWHCPILVLSHMFDGLQGTVTVADTLSKNCKHCGRLVEKSCEIFKFSLTNVPCPKTCEEVVAILTRLNVGRKCAATASGPLLGHCAITRPVTSSE